MPSVCSFPAWPGPLNFGTIEKTASVNAGARTTPSMVIGTASRNISRMPRRVIIRNCPVSPRPKAREMRGNTLTMIERKTMVPPTAAANRLPKCSRVLEPVGRKVASAASSVRTTGLSAAAPLGRTKRRAVAATSG